MHLIIKTEII